MGVTKNEARGALSAMAGALIEMLDDAEVAEAATARRDAANAVLLEVDTAAVTAWARADLFQAALVLAVATSDGDARLDLSDERPRLQEALDHTRTLSPRAADNIVEAFLPWVDLRVVART